MAHYLSTLLTQLRYFGGTTFCLPLVVVLFFDTVVLAQNGGSLNAIGLLQKPASLVPDSSVANQYAAPNQPYYVAQVTPPAVTPYTTTVTSGSSLPGIGSPAAAPAYVTPAYSPPPASSLVTSSLVTSSSGSAAPIVSPAAPVSAIDPYTVTKKKTLFDTLSGDYNSIVPETYKKMKRVCDLAQLDYTLINGTGLTTNDIRGRLRFSIPCKYIPTDTSAGGSQMGYFHLAPGAQFSFWNSLENDYMKSPNLFGAFVDFGVEPHLNKNFSFEASLRLGLYSDYKKITSESWRIQGRVIATFEVAERWQGTVGFLYLDRNRIKLLPSGGLIYRPHEDVICRLTFPDPKISMRLTRNGTTDWWGYIFANYGGDTWTISDDGGNSARTDYNDIRVAAGVEFDNASSFKGFAEVGGAFGRELVRPGWETYNPSNALYFRIGLRY
ncbi:MAG: hypothetical protein LBU65_14010 [Planctomycetaceae bacterium]|jgi:hypothetical protein|nr:hypothetical protein [Planctomycetaceae bacterium]